ncbi:zinc finger protein 668 [Entelurus aequoreus]|uniref:zinc finger protein 668 n=1 Tax=Entelurus aequoreus TaxID=161455 RepID=UPI002B1D5CB1|nr:zinc finger protein 668 [Entelurus aequoreus]
MSVEYTIDIQLTELGFPIIGQPQESLSASLPNSLPPCHTTTLTQNPHKENLLAIDQPSKQPDKETQVVLPCPSQSTQERSDTTSNLPILMFHPQVVLVNPAQSHAPQHQEDVPINPAQSQTPQQKVDSDSDDSNVSVVGDEEEEEEDDDGGEEEGHNNGSTNSGNFVCSVCGLKLPSDFKLQDHMNLHTGARPYCCAECGKRFSQIHNYRVHLRTHAQKVERPHCRVCLKVFFTNKALADHVTRAHWQDEFYECDLCKRVFTCVADCQDHINLHQSTPDVVCEKCGRHFDTPTSLKRHRMSSCYIIFKCTDCPKTFNKKDALLKHSFSHLGLLPYTCVRCHRHFRLATLYRQHKCQPGRIHCVACLREFVSQRDFQQHKKDTGCWGKQEDIGDQIRCLECGLRFANSDELKKHAGAHQRVLKCAECGKGFRSALLLMSHMGGHAGNSPCLCQSCGLGFPHQQSYDSHLKTCGQTPPPADALKKQQVRKSSSLKRKLETSDTNIVPRPASTESTDGLNNLAAPLTYSPVPAAWPASGADPADGCWKLTLNKTPPPGLDLVLLVPDGLSVSPNVSQKVPAHPQKILWTVVDDTDCEPLDLSKKASSPPVPCGPTPSDIPVSAVKSEQMELEITREAEERATLNHSAVVDHSYSTLKSDIKEEPSSPDSQPADQN